MHVGVALLCLLAAGTPAGDPPGVSVFWRPFFARPTVIPAPADDPLTGDKIALGRRLFGDTRLSGSGTRACASCHRPDLSFTDGQARARSLSGEPLRRNTPAVWNVAWSMSLHWDGAVPSLEAQARGPIEHAGELGGAWPVIVARLGADLAIEAAFARAFPASPAVTALTVTRALAAFERALVSPPTRFDRWIAGDASALGDKEIAGFRLFTGRAGCVGCHAGWRLTDDGFHDIGLAGDDPGRSAVPGAIPGLRAFKTPSLRELRWTAPYMHDGSIATLDGVLDHYTRKLTGRPGLASGLVHPLVLSTEEGASLHAFLLSLSSDDAPKEAAGQIGGGERGPSSAGSPEPK